MFLQNSLCSKIRPEQDAEKQSCVVLCIDSETILLSSDDNETVKQFSHRKYDVCRRKIGRLGGIDVEDLLSVLDDTP